MSVVHGSDADAIVDHAPTEQDLAGAGERLLGMFVAVCGAPDDLDVAASANQALREFDTLLRRL